MAYFPVCYPNLAKSKTQRTRGYSQGSMEECYLSPQNNGVGYIYSQFSPQKQVPIIEEEKYFVPAVPADIYCSPEPDKIKRGRLFSFSEGKKKADMIDFQVKYKTEVN